MVKAHDILMENGKFAHFRESEMVKIKGRFLVGSEAIDEVFVFTREGMTFPEAFDCAFKKNTTKKSTRDRSRENT